MQKNEQERLQSQFVVLYDLRQLAENAPVEELPSLLDQVERIVSDLQMRVLTEKLRGGFRG